MKVLITFFSQSGNTEKIAKAIHEITSINHESHLEPLKKVKIDDLNEYDLVFIGSACHDTDLAKPVLRLLKKIPNSPNYAIAGFFTHSTFLPEGDEKKKKLSEEWSGNCSKSFEKLELEKKVDLKGYFRCQGKPTPGIERFIHKSIITDEEEWAVFIEDLKKHPSETDVRNAKQFAQDILNEFLS